MNPLKRSNTCARILRTRTLALVAALAVVCLGGNGRVYAGLVITPTYDTSITSDPNHVAIEASIQSAINVYETKFSNPINVTIYFQEMGSGLGESTKNLYFTPYSSFRSALAAEPTDASKATALAHLPNQTNNPVTGTANMALSTANLKALGLGNFAGVTASDGHLYDGIIGINTSLTSPPNGQSGNYSLFSVVSHEIDEVLGYGSSLAQSFQTDVQPEDLYRFGQNSSTRNYTTTGNNAFFSIDGGATDLDQFNQSGGGADYGDWASSGTPQVQDAFGTPGSSPTLDSAELTVFDVIGYNMQGSAAPEPASMTLFGVGSLMLAGYGWRRCRPKNVE
jgi:hypothetical protein